MERTKVITKTTAARLIMAIVLVLGMAPAFAWQHAPMKAHADEGRTVADVLGISGTSVLNCLKSHEDDNYYLGTPYKYKPDANPIAGFEPSSDWRNPIGDPTGFGLCENQGVGMQCTGFVWHVLVNAGADPTSVPHLAQQHRGTWVAGWKKFIEQNNVEYRSFNSKEEMLASGFLHKGDIIMSWDRSAGGPSGISNYHHIGFFWGDSPNEDKYWHSGPVVNADTSNEVNCISPINAKTSDVLWWAIKTSNGPNPGSLEVKKESGDPGVTHDNALYSLAGAVFQLKQGSQVKYEAVADQSGIARFDEVEPDTYTLHESSAPDGYLAAADQTVTVGDGEAKSVTWSEPTAADRERLRVLKLDAKAGAAVAQGNARSLAGAQFTFRFYNGIYSEGNLPGQATRTWVMRSNEEGCASPLFGNAYKVAGDDFYLDSGGRISIPLGTVTVVETRPPDGYLLDNGSGGNPKLFVAHIVRDASAQGGARVEPVNYSDGELDGGFGTPKSSDNVKRGNIEGKKSDAHTADGRAQGDGSLGGAKIEVVNRSANAVLSPEDGTTMIAPGSVVCTLTTDAAGSFSTTNAEANGWAVPASWNGKALAYGTYELREASAPTGYNKNEAWLETVSIDGDGQVVARDFTDTVIRGNIAGVKTDSAALDKKAQGAATLSGAKVQVINRSAAAVLSPEDGTTMIEPGEVVCTLTTGEGGEFDTANSSLNGWSVPDGWNGQALAYGTYELRESQRSEGYLLNLEWAPVVNVRAEQQAVAVEQELGQDVYRGDLEFTKAEEETQKRLAGVPFMITSRTTGEHHVVVTDANGLVSTASTFNAHSGNTNANDGAVSVTDADGEQAVTVNEEKLDAAAGIWFNGHGNEQGAPVDDALGALPFDTYLIEELPCTANAGLKLASFELSIYRHMHTVHLGTIDNQPIPVIEQPTPRIGTTAVDAQSKSHFVSFEAPFTITDTVAYDDFEPGHRYTVEGEVHAVSDKGDDLGTAENEQGDPAKASITFTAEASAGTVSLDFAIDPTRTPQAAKFVVFETAKATVDGEEAVIGEHADLNDENQTVKPTEPKEPEKPKEPKEPKPEEPQEPQEPEKPQPKTPTVKTTATDKQSGSHEGRAEQSATIVDSVSYSGLEPGKKYRMVGTLVNKATGKPYTEDGTAFTEVQEFVPAEESGSVELRFNLKRPVPQGTQLVVFERAYGESGDLVASHEDIHSQDQTVSYGVPKAASTPATGSTFDKAGYWLANHLWVLIVAGLCLMGVGAWWLLSTDSKRLAPRRDDDEKS